ncbi:type II secretion system F family protein, partial [Alcanivorax sp.]|uniref:type II secretion system F family protein n=1 Tax=Alcanivorax sp. TaxID=1872427 RepID=UPI0025893C2A
KKRIKKVVISKSIGPIIMMSVAMIMAVLFSTKVIPEVKASLPQGFSLSGMAGMVDRVSQGVADGLPFLMAGVVVLAALVSWSVPNLTGGFRDKVLNRLPPWSVYKSITGVIWMISTAALLKKGADMKAVLQSQMKMARPWLKKELQTLHAGALRGQTIDQVMTTSGRGFPDEEVVDDIAIYSKTSSFTDALIMLAREWIEEVEESVRQKMSMLNFGAMLFMSAVVLFFGMGLFAIIQQVTQAAKGF